MNSAQNKLQTAQRTAAQQALNYRDTLLRHLQISTLRANDLLASVNGRRKVLGLLEIADLTADTKLDAVALYINQVFRFPNKQSVQWEIRGFPEAIEQLPDTGSRRKLRRLSLISQNSKPIRDSSLRCRNAFSSS